MTISVHGADHFGTTTSVHIGVQLWYTEPLNGQYMYRFGTSTSVHSLMLELIMTYVADIYI